MEQAHEHGLSPREREVARLVADGRSNQQICRELDMSLSTVKGHLESIFRKLGVENRTQLAKWYWERDLEEGE